MVQTITTWCLYTPSVVSAIVGGRQLGILHVMDTRLGNLLGLAILLSRSPRFLTLGGWAMTETDWCACVRACVRACVCVCLARVYVSVATNNLYLHQCQFPYEDICLCRCRGSVLVFAETDGGMSVGTGEGFQWKDAYIAMYTTISICLPDANMEHVHTYIPHIPWATLWVSNRSTPAAVRGSVA